MELRLHELAADEYAQRVLPLTESLWAYGRPFETYVAQTLELARTPYARHHFRTMALTDGSLPVLATCKRYERGARADNVHLRAAGIGAVFTPVEHRGHGYATAMLGLTLDQATREGFDFAYLFTDIHPQFYKPLGFVELPSRSISLRADGLPEDRVEAKTIEERDWTNVRRCFEACDARREFGLTRSPAVWDWIRTRLRYRFDKPQGQPVRLALHRGKSIAAYVIGQREPAHDALVVDEFAFSEAASARQVAPLLRNAAGDLRRIVAWLPPAPVRALLPRGSVRRRTGAVWMLAPLSPGGRRFLDLAVETRSADGAWALDHV